MALPNPNAILTNPGRFSIGATDLSLDYPHGGTALGETHKAAFLPNMKTHQVVAEEWGGIVTRAYYTGQAARLACVLRQWEQDAIGLIWPGGTKGQSGEALVLSDMDVAPKVGSEISAQVVVFTPLDADSHPSIVLYAALPLLDVAAKLQASAAENFELAVAWEASPDATNRQFAVGLRDDLVQAGHFP